MIVKPRDRAFGTINNRKGRTRTKKKKKKKKKRAANVRCRDWETRGKGAAGSRKWQKEKRVSGKGFGPSVLDLP
jgi:hypothetical protein